MNHELQATKQKMITAIQAAVQEFQANTGITVREIILMPSTAETHVDYTNSEAAIVKINLTM